VVPEKIWQMHGPAQGLIALHVPVHVCMLAFVCNCRAETVPAQRPPRSSTLKNVVLIFLFMACFSFPGQLPDGELAGLANVKLHMPMLVPGCEKTQVQPRILGQPALLVQKPRQVVL
jgi:hypothetical protein